MKKVSLILCTILLPFLYPAADPELVELTESEILVVANHMPRFNTNFAARTKISVFDIEEISKFCCHNRGPRYRLPKNGFATLARLEEMAGYLYDDINHENILLNGLIKLRSDYLELGLQSSRKEAKAQLGKDLLEYGRKNTNSINRLIAQCKKRIKRFKIVKKSIDELAQSTRASITSAMIWDYCSADLSGELLGEFAKRLPTPAKSMVQSEVHSHNLSALRASFMVHMNAVYGYL